VKLIDDLSDGRVDARAVTKLCTTETQQSSPSIHGQDAADKLNRTEHFYLAE